MKKIIIGLMLLVVMTGCNSKKEVEEEKEIKYTNITYRENHNDYACITFYGKGKYSMFDCDSEPTNYFFDSEAECTYKYVGDKIKFECKNNFVKHKNNYIVIKEWNEKEFRFTMDGKEKVFYAIEDEIEEE